MVDELKADVFTNLPAVVSYRANTKQPFTVSVVNLTDDDHQYMVLLKTYLSTGQVVTETPLPVDGHSWFELIAGDRQDIAGYFMFGETDVVLGIHVMERVENEEVAVEFISLKGY